ncbi:hypothetical protein RvY_17129 [Ramazzottius varieornatus]|uniref:Uncharacterized protein n=1 Tax=Ramazzottius varieornatus TaxID=947166 RepID=A0A1D1W119_RAMVA|nr:hypothetical protein RvY_17129 [Ramazzottius varieornatus]
MAEDELAPPPPIASPFIIPYPSDFMKPVDNFLLRCSVQVSGSSEGDLRQVDNAPSLVDGKSQRSADAAKGDTEGQSPTTKSSQSTLH